jgi:hypothetical protein
MTRTTGARGVLTPRWVRTGGEHTGAVTGPARLISSLAVALLLTGAEAAPEDTYWFEPQGSGGVTAKLGVRTADATTAATPVTLLIVIAGPATLEAEPTHLSDSVNAWEVKRSTRTDPADGGKTTTEEIRLTPKQSGVQPLPSVTVRFRAGPDADWQRAEWTEPLKELRPAPPPDIPPRPAPVPRSWALVILLSSAAVLLTAGLGLVLWLRLRRRPVPTLTERTLAALGSLDPAGEGFYAQLARVLRRFLGEREGLPAHERTTAELLETLAERPDWGPDRLEKLGEVLRHCDLALYAAAAAPEEERRADRERARAVVEADSPLSPRGRGGEGSSLAIRKT